MVPGAVTPGVCIRGPSVPAFRIQSIAVRQFLDFALQCVLLLCSMLQFKGEKELVPFMMSSIRYPSCFRAPIPLYSPRCVYSVQKIGRDSYLPRSAMAFISTSLFVNFSTSPSNACFRYFYCAVWTYPVSLLLQVLFIELVLYALGI